MSILVHTSEALSVARSEVMDSNWRPIGFNKEDLKETVTDIHVCAYKSVCNADIGDEQRPAVNHWILFLELASHRSVRVDMSPIGFGDKYMQGQILVSSKENALTNNAIHRLSFPTRGNPEVKDIVGLINNKGLQEYTFTPEMIGCRYWVYKVVLHLEGEGLLGSGSADQTWRAIPYYYMDPSGRVELEVEKGTFGLLYESV
ncbi:hypothetical protein E4U24_000589 [Claviceps purpurea]|nr:hypothetical protein E4U10_005121 [Claviceps purpurea]KAG6252292.1 hypothetical protein E4U24_000589 [Claviceps purpurea]KAG6276400.1 hypothetical protein E4U48_001636 [Claviceps purpurea]KAG6304354.1 hypothetical protein E4U45_001658 [Claviceps purpurea]